MKETVSEEGMKSVRRRNERDSIKRNEEIALEEWMKQCQKEKECQKKEKETVSEGERDSVRRRKRQCQKKEKVTVSEEGERDSVRRRRKSVRRRRKRQCQKEKETVSEGERDSVRIIIIIIGNLYSAFRNSKRITIELKEKHTMCKCTSIQNI